MLKNLTMIVLMAAPLVLIPSAFAQDIDTKALRDAASALQASNPKLADGLNQFANEEANESGAQDIEPEGQVAKDAEKHHQDNIKLLNDAASALQKTDPALAEKLTNIARDAVVEEKQEKPESAGTGGTNEMNPTNTTNTMNETNSAY